ncbi:MAG: YciI family protein [Acidobacteriia bacterium]|nr:YciI family protein [Terriglobia bacterium]
MRFMMIVKASADSEAGKMPSEELLAAMGKYNEELMKAGVLVDLAGLQPSSKGARVKFSGGQRSVIDGPFAETKELIGGFWIIKTNSKAEAIEWALRVPAPHGEGHEGEIEIRPFFEFEDFPPSEAVERAREMAQEIENNKR